MYAYLTKVQLKGIQQYETTQNKDITCLTGYVFVNMLIICLAYDGMYCVPEANTVIEEFVDIQSIDEYNVI